MTPSRSRLINAVVLFVLATGLSAHADNVPQKSAVYALSQEVQRSIRDVAARSEILILGETHGTQEVPAVAAAILTPLSQLGYRTLALEIPVDQRDPLLAWAKGTTSVVPGFFAAPSEDGRGNIELLTLIRTAVSPPFEWQLICFDESLNDFANPVPASMTPIQAEMIALGVKRDKAMARQLCDQFQQQTTKTKVLAICGSIHARTANHAAPDDLLNMLWPSFAAVLKSDKPDWQINSVNIVPHRGGYFNEGRINQFQDRAIEQGEFNRLKESDWNFQLDLPVVTPATFLKPPSDTAIVSRHGTFGMSLAVYNTLTAILRIVALLTLLPSISFLVGALLGWRTRYRNRRLAWCGSLFAVAVGAALAQQALLYFVLLQ